MALSNPNPWTYDLYRLIPEDGRRHEIVGGIRYVTPAPKIRHQRIVHRIAVELELAIRAAGGGGEVLAAPCDVRLSEIDVVQPDLMFVSTSRATIVGEEGVFGAPDLVVEVLSEGTRQRDEGSKRELYEECGVAEYWIVDPEMDTIVQLRRRRDGLGERSLLGSGTVLSTPLLPELSLDLSKIFE